jgi:rhodanese-related sulfurtransferase
MKKLITIILLFCSATIFAQTKVENVDAATFKKLIDEKKSVLIDLRTDDELKNKGYIKGATQIDWFGKNSEAVISKLDKKKTYLIYCAGGGRSGDCADLMKTQGFSHVVNLEKGFDDWKKKGFEVEQKK